MTTETLVNLAAPIGVFDSGVGGLSVMLTIRRHLPGEALLYVADSGFGPYGERTTAYIGARGTAIADFLVNEGAKAIVVACNTATAAVAATLRQRLALPIIAMEPAAKPAAKQSRSGVIGVLATPQTLSSERFARLVSEHAAGVLVVSEPCAALVAFVEGGVISGEQMTAAVERHVRALVEQKVDTIVLCCTHFQFLRGIVAAAAGAAIRIVDPGLAVVEELRRRLHAMGLLNVDATRHADRIFTSGELPLVTDAISKLWSSPANIAQLPAEYCLAPVRSG